jgi:hypothetical protein
MAGTAGLVVLVHWRDFHQLRTLKTPPVAGEEKKEGGKNIGKCHLNLF